VDIFDLASFVEHWLGPDFSGFIDFNSNDTVEFEDFAMMAEYWLIDLD